MQSKFSVGDKVEVLKRKEWMDVSLGGHISNTVKVEIGKIGKISEVREKKNSLWERIKKEGNRFNSTKFHYTVDFGDFETQFQENEIRKVI